MSPTIRNAVLSGIVLGVIAGLVVWYLERYETTRMFAEIEASLGRHAQFEDYLKEKGEWDGS